MLRSRLLALALALGCLAVLIVGARLRPAGAGHGTHEQLGLPACAWAVSLGLPCATCGMTTAVSLACHGRIVEAAVTQPAGLVFALVTAGVFWGALHSAVFGSRLERVGGALVRPRVIWGALGVVLLAWAYKAAVWQG